MAEARLLRLLHELGAGEIDHSGRSLAAHLEGTCNLLRLWGNPRPVCTAGLFHSIYGTESFSSGASTHAQRPRLRRLIGKRSEALAYWFGIADRAALFSAIEAERPRLIVSATGQRVPVGRASLAALIEIEVANVVEQMPHEPSLAPELVSAYRERFERAACLLSPFARESFAVAFDAYERLRAVHRA